MQYIINRQLIVVQLTTKSPGAVTPRDFYIMYENKVIHSDNILLFMVEYRKSKVLIKCTKEALAKDAGPSKGFLLRLI